MDGITRVKSISMALSCGHKCGYNVNFYFVVKCGSQNGSCDAIVDFKIHNIAAAIAIVDCNLKPCLLEKIVHVMIYSFIIILK